jgi:hypothetical protein
MRRSSIAKEPQLLLLNPIFGLPTRTINLVVDELSLLLEIGHHKTRVAPFSVTSALRITRRSQPLGFFNDYFVARTGQPHLAKIMHRVASATEHFGCTLWEILVEQKNHATASYEEH